MQLANFCVSLSQIAFSLGVNNLVVSLVTREGRAARAGRADKSFQVVLLIMKYEGDNRAIGYCFHGHAVCR